MAIRTIYLPQGRDVHHLARSLYFDDVCCKIVVTVVDAVRSSAVVETEELFFLVVKGLEGEEGRIGGGQRAGSLPQRALFSSRRVLPKQSLKRGVR